MVLDEAIRQAAREEAAKVVREELAKRHAQEDAKSDRATLTEAGAEFRYSANTLRQWIKQGRIAGFGRGRGLKVSRSEVRAFIDAGCPSSPEDAEGPSDSEMAKRAAELVKRHR